MTEESDRLKREPRPGKEQIADILRGDREMGNNEYILGYWLRSRQEQLADDQRPSQSQAQSQAQGDDQDLEDIQLSYRLSSHSQCMSQEVFEEAVDDFLRHQWAMACGTSRRKITGT
jgi:hypothetical protein